MKLKNKKYTMKEYRVLLFYKYVTVEEPEKFRDEHLQFCFENNIRGRVFIAGEGINGTVSGRIEDIKNYKTHLRSCPEFADIWFKEDEADEHAFLKTHVRVKREIVSSGLEVSLANGGKRLKPEELKKFYEEEKDFVIIDTRNTYESQIGKFKNAVTPEMDTFRDWKEIALQLKEQYKDKTVVTYCTGGIRCEKASAYLVEQGFKDVYQLEGGIVTYQKQYPDTFWEGSVFVFDERRITNDNSKKELKHVGSCYYCGEPASYYINCHNQNCDKLLVTCYECKYENDYCCSDECRESNNKRKKYHG